MAFRDVFGAVSDADSWEYVFWVDLDGDLCTARAAALVEQLRATTGWLRLFGCYASAAELTPP